MFIYLKSKRLRSGIHPRPISKLVLQRSNEETIFGGFNAELNLNHQVPSAYHLIMVYKICSVLQIGDCSTVKVDSYNDVISSLLYIQLLKVFEIIENVVLVKCKESGKAVSESLFLSGLARTFLCIIWLETNYNLQWV